MAPMHTDFVGSVYIYVENILFVFSFDFSQRKMFHEVFYSALLVVCVLNLVDGNMFPTPTSFQIILGLMNVL